MNLFESAKPEIKLVKKQKIANMTSEGRLGSS